MARRALVAAALVAAATGCGGAKSAPPTTAKVPPPPKPFRIVFPEGFTRVQMSLRVAKVAKIAVHERHKPVRISTKSYLTASARGVVRCFTPKLRTNLEGFLFPATYDFLRQTTSKQLVNAQLAAFCNSWRTLGLGYARSKNLTPYDVLRIASMIEEEAAVPGDRPKIAAVIYNRLRDRIPLGIDATLRYGLHIPPTQSITQSELASDTPYNTRRFYGLPPTPIGNPGLASLRAAAHPSALGYLYYVRIPGTNRHVFFESGTAYQQYLAAHGYGPHS